MIRALTAVVRGIEKVLDKKKLDWNIASMIPFADEGFDCEYYLKHAEGLIWQGKGFEHFPVQFISDETHDVLRAGCFGDYEYQWRTDPDAEKGWEIRVWAYNEVFERAISHPDEAYEFFVRVKSWLDYVESRAFAIIDTPDGKVVEKTGNLVISQFVYLYNYRGYPEVSSRNYIHNMTYSKRRESWEEVRFLAPDEDLETVRPEDLRQGPWIVPPRPDPT